MNYALIVIIAGNIQSAGAFNDQSSCQKAAKEFQLQEIKAVCVQQESLEQAFAKMQGFMKAFIVQMPK